MKRVSIIVCVFYSTVLFAFSETTSDFLKRMKAVKADSVKVETIRKFGESLEAENLIQAKLVYEYAVKTSQEIKNYSCLSKSYLSLGILYLSNSIYDTARMYYNTSLRYAQKANNNFDIAKSYNGIGNIFIYNSVLDSAAYYYLLAAKHMEKTKDNAATSKIYGNISSAFNQQNNIDKALSYGKLAVDFAERSKDATALAYAYNNYGVAYGKNNDSKNEIVCFIKSLQYFKEIGKIKNIADVYQNLSGANLSLKKFPEALNFIDSSIAYSKITEIDYDLAYAYIHKSVVCFNMNDLSNAERNLNEAIQYLQNDSSWILLREWNLQAYEINKAKGNYRDALKYQEHYYAFVDSIRNEEVQSNSNLFETKYETQKKENEILKQEHQIKKRNTWLTILAIILTASLLLFYFFSKYQKNKNLLLENEKKNQQQKIIALEKEKQLQATESILKGQEDERSRIAKDLHDGLGGLLSGVKYSLNNMKENVILSSENATSFERTVDMLDSGIQELRRVAHNMMPENLIKFGLDTALKDYCTSISNTGKLNINYSSFGMNNYNTETNVSITVYRVIQELINNTMKHAEATQSIVQIANENNILHITVEDNGKGFDVQNINNFKGAGWTNIQNRITYLKGKIHVDSNEKNGTSVIIEIPLA